ncbi:quinone-dependent dihydroorotate dehydrogenase [Raineyella sp.]|uniref:quinone-dependent dihydroorotate dehydrogenase n=1 Tax=Raineyella sp. TaxID=1911550 RepID=UPI002B216AD0|nr:quinone-dependent dihydroorotate dehydrogenase [Raineyella sp.]MEA5153533.1 quinone-dependent dihydroorotate dehydrogenase [Raineyella sp.]
MAVHIPGALVDAAYAGVGRPTLFRLGGGDPEVAHETTLDWLAWWGRTPARRALLELAFGSRGTPVEVAGIRFGGPVGLAAGMDKDARALMAWARLGFSHVEFGTVTGQPQPGNPKPRMFRLRPSHGVINRMGFNNAGSEAIAARLELAGVRRGNHAAGMPVGVSIGKTKVVALADAVEDYLSSLRRLVHLVDYLAINVSSPNTPGLRSLQGADELSGLVRALVDEAAVQAEESSQSTLGPVPVFVKIAPDLEWSAIDQALEVCAAAGAAGIIATNTTLGRDGLAPEDRPLAGQAGGLSGAPLTARALEVVSYVTAHTDLPVIGVGGIMTADDARAMLQAGASLVQIFTGFIYSGPGLVRDINRLTTDRLAVPRG